MELFLYHNVMRYACASRKAHLPAKGVHELVVVLQVLHASEALQTSGLSGARGGNGGQSSGARQHDLTTGGLGGLCSGHEGMYQ